MIGIVTQNAILFNDTATCLRAPWVSTKASCAAKASNLFLAETNEIPENLIEEEIKILSQGMSEEDTKKSRKNFHYQNFIFYESNNFKR